MFFELQMKKFKNYKYWDPQRSPALEGNCSESSFPLFGCWATERANQKTAQNNYYIEPDFGAPGFVIFKLYYLCCLSKPKIKFSNFATLKTLGKQDQESTDEELL